MRRFLSGQLSTNNDSPTAPHMIRAPSNELPEIRKRTVSQAGSLGNDNDTEDFRFNYESTPKPPLSLWDTTNTQMLELVRCKAFIRVLWLDPKIGRFRLRMKCLWTFRTQNSKEQAEIYLRGVPGIRMPGLIVTVEESRIWKDLNLPLNHREEATGMTTTGKTLCWRGTSLFTMEGFKKFNMIDFPYDRHFLNLERIEFVWRTHKDQADYFKSMKLVLFDIEASSMLPEWGTAPAYIRPLNESQGGDDMFEEDDEALLSPSIAAPPTYASKFTVHLRIERKFRFYIWQVFLIAYLITLLSCTPLGMPPIVDNLGDRLTVYSAGMLTLVAFKYGISDHLPSVPYQTLADKFLLACIVTIFVCAVATLYPYRVAKEDEVVERAIDLSENAAFFLVFVGWTLALAWIAMWKPSAREEWRQILEQDELEQDPFGKEEHEDSMSTNADDVTNGRHSSMHFGRQSKSIRARSPSVRAPTPHETPSGPVEEWTSGQAATFVSDLGLAGCARTITENAVDGRMLLELHQQGDELQTELNLTGLQARKLRRELDRQLAARSKKD